MSKFFWLAQSQQQPHNYLESKMIKRPLMGYQLPLVLLAGLFLSAPTIAERPDGVGKDKNYKQSQKHKSRGTYEHDRDRSLTLNAYFDDRRRMIIRDYYAQELHRGRCPPGLAKKHNGCMPPGQAKKWRRGYPLPRDVIFHDLPPRIVIELGIPPAGYRYVRVAQDILLITTGVGIVIDAVNDLGNI
jgi:Ni/Co efflux regulator RcnB